MIEATQEMYDEMVEKLLQKAKLTRAKYRYSEDKMAQCAGVVLPSGLPAMIPLNWKTEREKDNMFRALSMTAQQMEAMAIYLIGDTRWCESGPFCKHFKIPDPAKGECEIEEYKRGYLAVMKRYDYQIKNLPRALWTEAVSVSLKGPGITPRLRIASYVEGRRDTVEWIPSPFGDKPNQDLQAQINVLPDWWTVQ
jgi:hypothetical protein